MVISTGATNLRDTLLVLPPVENGPSDSARVLALEEKRLGLAILESENLAVATDVELALELHHQQLLQSHSPSLLTPVVCFMGLFPEFRE